MKKPRLKSISLLKKELWRVFALYIKERDNWTCITCGSTDRSQIHAGHGLMKKNNGILLYFHPVNVHAQCLTCNVFREGEGIRYCLALIKKYGESTVQGLINIVPESKAFKPDREWYEGQILLYKGLLESQSSSRV